MPDRPGRGVRRARVVALGVLLASLLGQLLLVVTVSTSLQEVSFRWMGLAGVALPTAVGLAAAATLAAVVAARLGSARVPAVVGLGLAWAVVVVLAAPTLRGMVAPRRPVEGRELSVLTQNLWYQNPDPAATARQVLDADADVLVLVEYTPAHARALRAAGVDERYEHRWEDPDELGAGLAVMSKVPFDDVRSLRTWGGAARVRLQLSGRALELYAVHPVAPSDTWGLRRWKGDYASLTAALEHVGPDVVVAGDFNATGAHRRFRRLMQVSGTRDAQDVAGAGFAATWPGAGPVPPVMRLDHVLVGDDLGVDGVEVLDDIGADHRGVLARLRVPTGRS